jgi:hypothetical protein
LIKPDGGVTRLVPLDEGPGVERGK